MLDVGNEWGQNLGGVAFLVMVVLGFGDGEVDGCTMRFVRNDLKPGTTSSNPPMTILLSAALKVEQPMTAVVVLSTWP